MPFDNLVRFLQEKTKNLKKGDWIALALTGVLLLVVALPAPSAGSAKKEKSSMHVAENKTEENQEKQGDYQREYASVLEKELEEALERMEGVGKVKVMITLADSGEAIVEKDRKMQTDEVTEQDTSGEKRTTKEEKTEWETVYTKTGDGTYPYIEKEVCPKIEGVLVVAQGGDKKTVVRDISDIVMALFHVEAHKIKVVKMSSMEE